MSSESRDNLQPDRVSDVGQVHYVRHAKKFPIARPLPTTARPNAQALSACRHFSNLIGRADDVGSRR